MRNLNQLYMLWLVLATQHIHISMHAHTIHLVGDGKQLDLKALVATRSHAGGVPRTRVIIKHRSATLTSHLSNTVEQSNQI